MHLKRRILLQKSFHSITRKNHKNPSPWYASCPAGLLFSVKVTYLVKHMFFLLSCVRPDQVFEGKRHGVHPQNGIPGFALHFPKELSYGYLRFEDNGKIPL